MTYRTKYYGMPINEISANISRVITDTGWKPNHIIISSLTSYWYESILILIPILKTLIPDAQITLIGPYSVFETQHATRLKLDYIVKDFISLENEIPDFEIYFQPITQMLNNGKYIHFGGLKYTKNNIVENLIKQLEVLQKRNIRDFVIFEENIFKDNCMYLNDLFDQMEEGILKGTFLDCVV